MNIFSIFPYSIVILLLFDIAVGKDKKPYFILHDLTFEEVYNEYFENWSGEILQDGEAITIRAPIKKDLPDSMMLSFEIEYKDDVVIDTEISICDCFDDNKYGKGVLEKGTPEGKFPTSCPVSKSKDYVVDTYVFPHDKIPPDTEDGPVKLYAYIYENDNEESYVTIRGEGEIIHK